MGVTTQDLHGDGSDATSATPGSYGQAPRGYRLPEATRLGGVSLQVANLARSLAFYVNVLGLRVESSSPATAVLTSHGDPRPLVTLHERPGARSAVRSGRLGLYHFAILLPSRLALGQFVRHLADTGAQAGAGDHLVSEAFYLNDPDGLGIEVYADRPRSTWKRRGPELMMATDPVDVRGLVALAEGQPWRGMPAGTVMGHVHLHVASIPAASDFFSEAIGFDRMVWGYPGALFLGAGGYHHHLGTNTWAGAGARNPSEDDARLLEWTIELPTADDVDAVRSSLADAGYTNEPAGPGALATTDPWGTRIRITSGTR